MVCQECVLDHLSKDHIVMKSANYYDKHLKEIQGLCDNVEDLSLKNRNVDEAMKTVDESFTSHLKKLADQLQKQEQTGKRCLQMLKESWQEDLKKLKIIERLKKLMEFDGTGEEYKIMALDLFQKFITASPDPVRASAS